MFGDGACRPQTAGDVLGDGATSGYLTLLKREDRILLTCIGGRVSVEAL